MFDKKYPKQNVIITYYDIQYRNTLPDVSFDECLYNGFNCFIKDSLAPRQEQRLNLEWDRARVLSKKEDVWKRDFASTAQYAINCTNGYLYGIAPATAMLDDGTQFQRTWAVLFDSNTKQFSTDGAISISLTKSIEELEKAGIIPIQKDMLTQGDIYQIRMYLSNNFPRTQMFGEKATSQEETQR